jgi:hypothetical protein
VVCSHPNGRYPGREVSDVFEQEPAGLGADAYVDYCRDFCRRQSVDLFMVGRKLLAIVTAAERVAPTRVLAAADAAALQTLANKADVYAALAQEDACVPEYALVHDVPTFDAAWERLRARHELLCFKPTVSVYGLGFYIIADEGEALKKLRAGERLYLSCEEARRRMAEGKPRLLMPYLPGPERSVDCLAHEGHLVTCIVRRKQAGGQVIEDQPALVDVVRRLTARFRLMNLFNVQFRDAGGRSYLLEINARMSGGLPFAGQSGLNLPLWAIRLALGRATPADVPAPRTGIWVPQPEPASAP